MNDREWLKKLVVLAERFRATPIVDDDFPEMRNNFDHAMQDARAYIDSPRRTIVCLCGSTKYMDAFSRENARLTLAGEIVLSVGHDMKAEKQSLDKLPDRLHRKAKEALDELHLRKIDLADYVFVLNVNGYVGESTANEIRYATEIGKKIMYLEPDQVTH